MFSLTITDCPAGFQIPGIDDILMCSVDEKCLGIQCCINIDFKIKKLMMKTWLILDPCDFTFSVGFEKVTYDLTLFTYEWGKTETAEISDFLVIK